MPDLQEYITELQTIAATMDASNIARRKDTAHLKAQINAIQTACQHAFTEIKALNRTLPE